jgi:hypothetical protein
MRWMKMSLPLAWGAMALNLAATGAMAETALQFEKALPLDGPEMLQPSGLAMVQGACFLVSSKHDDQVFAVTLGGNKAEYKEAFRITRPAGAEALKLVWRGLAGDEAGGFFALSETAYRVMRLDKKGSGEWYGPSILDAGTEIGLFGGDNSGPDGVAHIGKGKVLIGASRDPRGLISLAMQGDKAELKPYKCETSKASVPKGRKPDFTDLTALTHAGVTTVYALVGSADAICTLKPGEGGALEENVCFSFAATAQDANVRYKGLKGLGRGLAVDEGRIYVVLDNKGLARESDPKDRRPQILIFKRPG